MNETERMLREINGLLGAMGNKPIQVTLQGPVPELTLLRVVKQEYKARLLEAQGAALPMPEASQRRRAWRAVAGPSALRRRQSNPCEEGRTGNRSRRVP